MKLATTVQYRLRISKIQVNIIMLSNYLLVEFHSSPFASTIDLLQLTLVSMDASFFKGESKNNAMSTLRLFSSIVPFE